MASHNTSRPSTPPASIACYNDKYATSPLFDKTTFARDDRDVDTGILKTAEYHDDPETAPLYPTATSDSSSHGRERSRQFCWGALTGAVALLLLLAAGGAFVHTTDVGTKFLREQLEKLQDWKEEQQYLASGQNSSLITGQEDTLVAGEIDALKVSQRDWAAVDTFFFFGDSYTSTGDLYKRPNNILTDNPLKSDGTFTKAPNWPSFLANVYNNTPSTALNFAVGGSVVDRNLVTPFLLGCDLHEEAGLFLDKLTSDTPQYTWQAETTAFIFWFGVNDVHGSAKNSDIPGLYAKIFESYATEVGKLYNGGARNFLFLTVPPYIRAAHASGSSDPLIYAGNLKSEINEHEHITNWNAHIEQLRTDLRRNHSDAIAAVFDSHRFFAELLEQPRKFSQMDGVEDTVNLCNAVQGDVPYYEQTCPDGARVGAHAWTPLHATYPVHNAIAAQVAQDCFAAGGWTGFCM